uniref:Uncharacterized protein n=1 Tax=Anopheles funestus TaxID=62324 RepID=A0A182RBY1_ANOFN
MKKNEKYSPSSKKLLTNLGRATCFVCTLSSCEQNARGVSVPLRPGSAFGTSVCMSVYFQ